ncbi:molybdate ABC transporter substrate-binding protein [Roseospira visakhapatnamensis]|uniref:Molybdate transport system substrate-binding protein n=1 Tax=Roseospira visakhapatnamensis TaxID=390880 RepID=A0A7W6RBZ5_9PROT|nr:molybdate ABC transporter substrate-binding protein [Roseospira visakhapatnamensis]MBB4265605.1 molybdate transport system substrate-binding protein [Roseospira visakhapatnamensis]
MPILSRRQALRLPLIAVLGGMAHTAAASSAHAQATATVFADPSLKPALTSLIPAFRKETGAGLMFAYGDAKGAVGSSDRLVHDVILLAGREAMAPFVPSGQVETPVDLATGGLALVAAPGLAEPVAVSRDMAWESWVSERRPLTVVDPEIDALGQRAMDALRSMGWGEGVSKSIHLAPSMRAVLDLVARGEAGLGVAHASAAAADGRVRVVGPLPPDTYPPVVYQVAIRQGVAADSPARAFVHFLYGDAGRRALRTAGVTPLVP